MGQPFTVKSVPTSGCAPVRLRFTWALADAVVFVGEVHGLFRSENWWEDHRHLPSGKRLYNHGKAPCFIGKSTINGPFLRFSGISWDLVGFHGIEPSTNRGPSVFFGNLAIKRRDWRWLKHKIWWLEHQPCWLGHQTYRFCHQRSWYKGNLIVLVIRKGDTPSKMIQRWRFNNVEPSELMFLFPHKNDDFIWQLVIQPSKTVV